MLKTFAQTLALGAMMLSVSTLSNTANANPCAKTKWKPATGVFGDVTFGMNITDAKKIMSKKFSGQFTYSDDEGSTALVFKPNHRETFDMIVIGIMDGRVVKLAISYSSEFQNKLGGSAKAFMAVTKKMISNLNEKADKVDTETRGTVTATWYKNGGATLEIIGKDPSTIFIRYTCVDLEEELAAKKAANTNFGL